MPFCTNCGSQVGPADKFCAICGAPQNPTTGHPFSTTPPGSASSGDLLGSMSPRTASMLCYVPWMGWIAAIVILASPRFQKDNSVRFHAFQGLYLFVGWLLVRMVLDPMLDYSHVGGLHFISSLAHLVMLVAWVFMLIKTSQNQTYSLPIIGELAERSVAEQKLF